MVVDTIDLEPIAQGYYLGALLVEGATVWYSDVVEGGIKRLTADGAVPMAATCTSPWYRQ